MFVVMIKSENGERTKNFDFQFLSIYIEEVTPTQSLPKSIVQLSFWIGGCGKLGVFVQSSVIYRLTLVVLL